MVPRQEEEKLRGGTTSHELRGAETGVSTESLISTSARACTRAAAGTGERASDRWGKRQEVNRQPTCAPPPQQEVADMILTAPQRGVGTVSILLRGTSSRSTEAGGLEVAGVNEAGDASDAYHSTGAVDSTYRGDSLSPGKTTPPPPGRRSPTLPARLRTSVGVILSMGIQSRVQAGLDQHQSLSNSKDNTLQLA